MHAFDAPKAALLIIFNGYRPTGPYLLIVVLFSWQIIVEGGWRNRVIRPLMRELAIPMVELWNQSVPLWEQHSWKNPNGDCTHHCHPSSYQVRAASKAEDVMSSARTMRIACISKICWTYLE